MNKKFFYSALLVLLIIALLYGCGRNNPASETAGAASKEAIVSTPEPADFSDPEAKPAEALTDEQALSAVKRCCYAANPALEDMEKAGEYPVYWDISSSDEQEIVVLFRSYTGAQNRYYIDRITGDTYVTEFVPGITPEEQQTEERFNIRDYF